jgi:hypothetical protein
VRLVVGPLVAVGNGVGAGDVEGWFVVALLPLGSGADAVAESVRRAHKECDHDTVAVLLRVMRAAAAVLLRVTRAAAAVLLRVT